MKSSWGELGPTGWSEKETTSDLQESTFYKVVRAEARFRLKRGHEARRVNCAHLWFAVAGKEQLESKRTVV